MRSMGLRAEKNLFWWVVVSGDAKSPVLEGVDKIRCPRSYDEARMLSHFRERILSLFAEQKPDAVSLKRPEVFKRRASNVSSMDTRLRVEGVLLEAAHSSGKTTEALLWTQVSKGMGSDSAKQYVERGGEVRGITLSVKDGSATKPCSRPLLD